MTLTDARFEQLRGPEHQNLTGKNRHFIARLRVTPNALAFFAHGKATERRDFYSLPLQQCLRNFIEYEFQKVGGFVAR